jgi:hypothetical protein
MFKFSMLLTFCMSILLTSCGGGASSFKNDSESVKKMAIDMRKGNASAVKLITSLRPSAADCEAIMESADDAKLLLTYADKLYGELPPDGLSIGDEARTETIVFTAKSDDLAAGTNPDLPGGYTGLKFKKGLTVYGFKYVKPSETSGMAYDGLIYTGSKFVFIPKMFRAFKG